MTEHAGLLQAIRDAPDDDTPRLIYADWLDEQGEALRAEWIRLHCRLTQFCILDRNDNFQLFISDDLRPGMRENLLAPLLSLGLTLYEHATGYSGCRFQFRRGFVEEIQVHGEDEAELVIKRLDEVCQRTPLRCVRFIPGQKYDRYFERSDPRTLNFVRMLMQTPAVGLLDTVDLGWYLLGDAAGRAILDSPYLRPGQWLALSGQRFNPPVREAILKRFGERAILEEEIPF